MFNLLRMTKNVFCLLILYGILSQGICTSTEETENSSALLIRKKRVLGFKSNISEAPFLVSLVTNGINHCPATLLTNSVAITSAECFNFPRPTEWKIQGDSSYHQVTNVILYGNYNSSHPAVNNLALAFFHPPINELLTQNKPIKIYSGNLAATQSLPIAFNWSHKTVVGPRQQYVNVIKKVLLMLISYEYCHNYYPDKVKPGNICTQTSWKGHHCQHLDTGAPLVMENELVGIFAFRGRNVETNPDVFMNLLDHGFRRWIHEHVPTLRLF